MKPAGPVLRAVEWQVQHVPHADGLTFLRHGHYAKGGANTSTDRHGLYRAGLFVGDLYGVALWMPPTRAAAETVDPEWGGVLALSRLAVAPEVPTNGASFLLGRAMRMIDRARWPTLLTYADTAEGHTGAIYRATGWVCLGPVPAGDVWIGPDGRQMGRKRGGRNMSAEQMRAAGYVRKPAAAKIKFVHWTKDAARRIFSPTTVTEPRSLDPATVTGTDDPEESPT